MCVYVEIYSGISMFCMHELHLSICLSTDPAVYTYKCICIGVFDSVYTWICTFMCIRIRAILSVGGTPCWQTEVARCEYSEYPRAMPIRP
jgi:hypothetical protein